MQSTTVPLTAAYWVGLAAHALAHRWPHVPPEQLDEVAAELHRDESLQALPPADAVALWLQPLKIDAGVRTTDADRLSA